MSWCIGIMIFKWLYPLFLTTSVFVCVNAHCISKEIALVEIDRKSCIVQYLPNIQDATKKLRLHLYMCKTLCMWCSKVFIFKHHEHIAWHLPAIKNAQIWHDFLFILCNNGRSLSDDLFLENATSVRVVLIGKT